MGYQLAKLEYFRHILLFEFKRGEKAAEAARNICAMYGDNAIGERTTKKNGFLVLRRIVLTLVTLHVQGKLRCFMNILINNDPRQCTRELSYVMTVTTPCDNCIQWARCMGTACSKPNPQKPASGHMCITACSSSIGSSTTSTIPILVTRNGVLMLK